MRKHSVRNWLHAILDLLPVILIPVFMVYSHRHDMTERTQVNIQYKYETNEVNTIDDLIIGNIYHMNIENDSINAYFNFNNPNTLIQLDFVKIDYVNIESDILPDEVFVEVFEDNGTPFVRFEFSDLNANLYIYYFANNNNYMTTLDCGSQKDIDINISGDFVVHELNYSSLNDNSIFSSSTFNVIESVNVVDTNSDIMSVIMNDLNNVTDKYFNMDKTFNLGAIHDWVNANMFQNEPPLVANIVWHIISYEFIMDLIFLVYAVFMFVIDFADRCLNAFFDKSFGGGR